MTDCSAPSYSNVSINIENSVSDHHDIDRNIREFNFAKSVSSGQSLAERDESLFYIYAPDAHLRSVLIIYFCIDIYMMFSVLNCSL